MSSLIATFSRLTLNSGLLSKSVIAPIATNNIFVRNFKFIDKPKPGAKHLWRIVHYPKNKKYTVEPLDYTNLAGRDPVTGRKIHEGIGGGIKHKVHWIKYERDGPSGENEYRTDKVIEIFKDGTRSANTALIASGNEMSYILATVNMKVGDLLRTSRFIPRIPVRPNEGDAFPLGALQTGTIVHCVENYPNSHYHYIRAAGTYATVIRKFDDKVVVQFPNKREYAIDQRCMATVGRVSNIEHSRTPIGSAWRLRWLGYRPRSGLWHRKTGRHGRKIKPIKPMRVIEKIEPSKTIKMTMTKKV